MTSICGPTGGSRHPARWNRDKTDEWSTRMRWFSRGDLDGFFGLALDNLVQLLLIAALWKFELKAGDELLFARVLPGVAVSLLVGNLVYAWQAPRLAPQTGRTDVCALPYGIN